MICKINMYAAIAGCFANKKKVKKKGENHHSMRKPGLSVDAHWIPMRDVIEEKRCKRAKRAKRAKRSRDEDEGEKRQKWEVVL